MKPPSTIQGRGRARGPVSFPLKQDPSYELFEFACHEGNFLSMSSMLGGARLLDN
jgi:hypothetical protein